MMRRTLIVATALAVLLVTIAFAADQERENSAAARRREDIAAVIQARVNSQQPVKLSAERITLAGDVLTLAGRVRIRFDDTFIVTDEARFNQEAKRVELIGSVRAFFNVTDRGPASSVTIVAANNR
jgi:lipopolysaccharide assembly outer membrane protein LptD (OstA)